MLKPVLWHTLYKLAELGAHSKAIRISTTELAEKLGISQQTASRHLITLEKLGYIERKISVRGEEVRVSDIGIEELKKIYQNLHSMFEGAPTALIFEGEVFTGFGEGGYYISQNGYRNQFITKLGFNPYPGTLNLKLSSSFDLRAKKELGLYPAVKIEGFKNEKRSFGQVQCYPALINDEVEGAVVLIARTHYNASVLEVIAPVYLRNQLNLKDGDKVRVRVPISGS